MISEDGDAPPDDGRIEPDGGNPGLPDPAPAIPGPEEWAEEERQEQAIHDLHRQNREQPDSLLVGCMAIAITLVFICTFGPALFSAVSSLREWIAR